MNQIKVTRCKGEGQGECRRCKQTKGWGLNWMCILYEIEGREGCYCFDCVKEILKGGGCLKWLKTDACATERSFPKAL